MKHRLVTLSLWAALLFPTGVRADTASSPTEDDARANAWDRSVALQQKGDLGEARAVLVRAFGKNGSYYIRLRLAYLALLDGDYVEAVDGYRALLSEPEGQDDPDPRAGLADAEVGLGYLYVGMGLRDQAREHFARALADSPDHPGARESLRQVHPDPVAEPEAWVGLAGQSFGMDRYLGQAVFAHVPVALGSGFTLHAAGRYLHFSPSGSGSPWAFAGQRRRSVSEGQGFLGASYHTLRFGADLTGILTGGSGAGTVAGAAAGVRVGSFRGLLVDGNVLRVPGLGAHAQASSRLYTWLGPHVALEAGARVTAHDGTSASFAFGGTVVHSGFAFHLLGHAGRERMTFHPHSYGLLPADKDSLWGGLATAVAPLSPALRLFVQGQYERLGQDGAQGYLWSASAGLSFGIGTH